MIHIISSQQTTNGDLLEPVQKASFIRVLSDILQDVLSMVPGHTDKETSPFSNTEMYLMPISRMFTDHTLLKIKVSGLLTHKNIGRQNGDMN